MSMERFLTQHDLVFNGLPEKWLDGLFLGNGNMGAMMWGNGAPLIFTLDKYDTWEERSSFQYSSDHTYKDLRALIEEKKFDEAKQKYEDKLKGEKIFPTRLPLPRLELGFGAKFQAANAHLHLDTASFTVRLDLGYANCEMEGFVHADNNLLVLLTDANRGGAPFFTPRITRDHLKDDVKQKLKQWGYPEPQQGAIPLNYAPDGLNYFLQEAPNGAGFKAYFIAYANIPIGNSKQLFLLALLTDWDLVIRPETAGTEKSLLDCFVTEVQSLFYECQKTSYSRLKEEHHKYWDSFWSKSFISIPDNILENLYYVELYKMACNSREGRFPCSLQGIWTNDGELPPFSGDYRLDINLPASYWGIYASNHLELGEPLYRTFFDMLPKFEQNCRNFFGFEGAWSRCSMSLGGVPLNGHYSTELWLGNGALLAHLFWLQWKYSQDVDFLKGRAYPFLKSFFHTYANLLEATDADRLSLPFSSIPGYSGNSPDAWGRNPNCDLALIHFLGSAILEANQVLNASEDKDFVGRVQDILQKLVIYPADVDGLMVMENSPLKSSQWHHNHLLGIYPLSTIALDSGDPSSQTSKQKDTYLINQSLKKVIQIGSWEWVGGSFPWMSAIAARAGNSYLAYWYLQEYFKFIRDNTMHTNGDSFGLAFSKYAYERMTLEGGFCVVAAILEMLLQSHNNLIRIFPAVPPSWEDIRFDTLRAEGGFLVSAMRSKGKLIYVSISSEKGGSCKVRNDFDNLVDLSRKTGDVVISEKVFNERPAILEFILQPGDTVRLSALPYKATANALEKLGPTQVSIPRVFSGINFFGHHASALNPYHPDTPRRPQQ